MLIRRTLPAWVAAWSLGAAFAIAQEPDAEHPALKAARAQYLTESRERLAPVQKRQRARLEALHKELVGKGEREAAAAVKADLDELDQPAGDRAPSPFVGSWIVRYEGGPTRTYAIRVDGSVLFVETQQIGRIARVGEDWVLDFGDNKLERLTRMPGIRVEHFNPKEGFLKGEKAERTGLAERLNNAPHDQERFAVSDVSLLDSPRIR